MKRKATALMTALILAAGLSACGGDTPTAGNNPDPELEQRIEELEAENAELKAQLDNSDSTDSNQQSEADSLLQATIQSPETSGVCGANLTWYYQNGILAITGTGEMTDYGWSKKSETSTDYIPNNPWYDLGDKIGWVIIDDGVTSIGSLAFAGCLEMSKVIIPNTVVNIKDDSFWSRKNLETIIYDNQSYTYEEFESQLEELGLRPASEELPAEAPAVAPAE